MNAKAAVFVDAMQIDPIVRISPVSNIGESAVFSLIERFRNILISRGATPLVANFRDRLQMSLALCIKLALVLGRVGRRHANFLSRYIYALLAHCVELLALRSLLDELV